jgi:c(7)-type cytochrome triheme protein
MGPARRSWRVAACLAAAGLGALLVVACTSQNPVMTALFDGVPLPGAGTEPAPVVKEPRRAKYKKPKPAVTFVEVPDLPPAVDWRGIYASLPRNDDAVAWVKALETKAITPKPGLAPDAKDEDPNDMEVELDSTGAASKALFPHKPHTLWMGCPACHTAIFEMEKGKAKMTMAGMGEGQWCGACHGKVAAPELTTCAACHPGMK